MVNPKARDLDFISAFAFDMDSVLVEANPLRECVADRYNTTIEDIKTFENGFETFTFHVDGISQTEMYNLIRDIIIEESPSWLPTPFMQPVMKYINQVTGLPITVVTARDKATEEVTYNWLYENLDGVPFRAIICSGMAKEIVLKNMCTVFFVDDRLKTIIKLVNHIDMPILYKRPWNQGRLDPGTIQINDLRDMIPIVNLYNRVRPMQWPADVPYPKPNGERITKKYATII
jgi:hypothetical protein